MVCFTGARHPQSTALHSRQLLAVCQCCHSSLVRGAGWRSRLSCWRYRRVCFYPSRHRCRTNSKPTASCWAWRRSETRASRGSGYHAVPHRNPLGWTRTSLPADRQPSVCTRHAHLCTSRRSRLWIVRIWTGACSSWDARHFACGSARSSSCAPLLRTTSPSVPRSHSFQVAFSSSSSTCRGRGRPGASTGSGFHPKQQGAIHFSSSFLRAQGKAPQVQSSELQTITRIVAEQSRILTALATKHAISADPLDALAGGGGSGSDGLFRIGWGPAALDALRQKLQQDLEHITQRVFGNCQLQEQGASPFELPYGCVSMKGHLIKQVPLQWSKVHTYFMFALAETFDLMHAGEWPAAQALTALSLVAEEQAALDHWSWGMDWLRT